MRAIESEAISEAIAQAAVDACCDLSADTLEALHQALDREESPLCREALGTLIENARIARERRVPICQDTGVAVVFAEMGSEVSVKGATLFGAIEEGVRRGYTGGLRLSIVSDPFKRVNTRDNTPPVVHVETTEGDALKLFLMAKGGGCENASCLAMLKPSDGREGVADFIVDSVMKNAQNSCPPVVVGVGIGGTMDKAALIAKKSLLRPLGTHHPDDDTAQLETELLERINRSGIGPAGLGGTATALAVHIETHPCHIASLPVAVNLECHAHRHREIVL